MCIPCVCKVHSKGIQHVFCVHSMLMPCVPEAMCMPWALHAYYMLMPCVCHVDAMCMTYAMCAGVFNEHAKLLLQFYA